MAEQRNQTEKGPRRFRRPIAVIVSRFPLITETFILREIIELERQGQPVVLVSMIREDQRVVHPETHEWTDRVIHAPFLSSRVVAAFLRACIRSPLLIGGLLSWIVVRSIASPRMLSRSLLLLPQATFFAERIAAQDIRHLHAHFATFPATIAHIVSKLTGASYSFTAHAHDIFVNRRLLREKVGAAAFIRAISTFNKAFLDNLYPREAAQKISVVHVGIEPGNYARDRNAVESARQTGSILCIAALKPYKGIPFLIEACRLMAAEDVRFSLDIIGSGPLHARIDEQIAAAGLGSRVRLLGPMPQDRVATAIRACELFVLPSVIAADGQMEGIPVALMEAMAAGKPVIGTSISGIPELIDDHVSGLLVDPANPRQLAQAMTTLLGNPEMREDLGLAARRKIEEEFTLEKTAKSVLDLIDRHNPPVSLEDVDSSDEVFDPSASYGVVKSHRGSDSAVYELIESRERECSRLIVKRHLSREGESRPPDLRSAEEYELLRRLHTHLSGSAGQDPVSVSVPRPLMLDRVNATLSMTRMEGAALDSIIRNARSGHPHARSRLDHAARMSGIWLERFQSFERAEGEAALTRMRVEALSHLEFARRSLGSSAARRVRDRIERLADEIAVAAPRAVSHHGDLWPGNIFVADDAVGVIDLEGYRLGLPAEDIGYLFFHTGLYLAYRAESCFEMFRQSFFTGYGRISAEAELELSTISAALQFAVRPSSHGFAQQFLVSRYLRRELLG